MDCKKTNKILQIDGPSGAASCGTAVPAVNNITLEQDAQATASPHGRDAHATPNDPTTIKIRQGAYLPHWTREGAAYSVNFRLFDSLPQEVLEGWVEERDRLMKKAEKLSRPLGAKEQERLQHLFSEKVEQYLDAGHGECWLRQDKIAQLVTDALKEFADERYRLISWCIMPNHVHVIVEPLAGNALSGILHSWKSYTSKEANKLLGRAGHFWQVEYFDHLVRDEEDFQHCLEYVWTNPERAGLQNWKWRGITDGAASCGTAVPAVNNITLEQDAQAAASPHGRDAHATHGQDARAT